MIFFLVLLGLVLVAQIAELFIPALPWFYNAHVYIVPVIVFYGAMALPFPLMQRVQHLEDLIKRRNR